MFSLIKAPRPPYALALTGALSQFKPRRDFSKLIIPNLSKAVFMLDRTPAAFAFSTFPIMKHLSLGVPS